ncbi:MAG TPA: TolC family protein [Candidatus Methylomirabilis sp.]
MRRTTLVVWLGACLAAAPAALAQNAPMSLDVDQAVRLALQNNPGYKQAQAGVSLAYAQRAGALVDLLPRLSGSWNYSDATSSTDLNDQPSEIVTYLDGQLNPIRTEVTELTNFKLDSRSKIGNMDLSVTENISLSQWFNYRSARAAAEAELYGEDVAAQRLVYDVREQFYLGLRAEALLQVQTLDLDLAQNELRRTQTMFDLGSVAKADVLKARVRVAEAEVSLIRQANSVNVAHSLLAIQLGMDPTNRFDLQGDLEISAVELDSLRAMEEALVRPDMKQAEADIRSASAGYTAAKSSRFPSLFASYSTGLTRGDRSSTNLDGSESYDPVANTITTTISSRDESGDVQGDNWSVRVGATVNIDALLNTPRDRVARANLRLAEERKAALRLTVLQEVERATLDIRASVSAIGSAEQGVAAAEEDVRLSQERYQQGLGTFLDLLQAQVALTRARSTLVDAKTSLKIAEADLERARGVPVDY